MNISKRIMIPSLDNIRDLGGMETMDHRRIRNQVLIRSESLSRISAEDLGLLGKVTAVFDLRSPFEAEHDKDLLPPLAKYCHFPLLNDEKAGSGPNAYDESLLNDLKKNDNIGYQQMIVFYENLVLDQNSRKNLGLILRKMLKDYQENSKSCFLFHCTSGKDRCGFLAAVIQELLGVKRKDIFDDYLSTNAYLKNEKDKIMKMTASIIPDDGQELLLGPIEKLMADYCICRNEYLEASYRIIDEYYGSFKTFINRGLGLDDEFVIDFQKSFSI